MMKAVFVVCDNILSPLGSTTAENMAALLEDKSAVAPRIFQGLGDQSFSVSVFPDNWEKNAALSQGTGSYSRFERMVIFSVSGALDECGISLRQPDTILILSSTKGNISLLEKEGPQPAPEEIALSGSAAKIGRYFSAANTPLVISNACISGLTALLTGKRLLESGKYTHAVVVGADELSDFIVSGFHSFQAISTTTCRPFDKDRNGINLGEAAASMVLSTQKTGRGIMISGGAVSNDANHISGPSRTGEELGIAIRRAMQQAGTKAADIGFISAHGTATLYNDEMEARAFSLSGMEDIPVNSIKGYFGHTLGAAGVLESVVATQSLLSHNFFPTRGFRELGVTKPLNVCSRLTTIETRHCLKTASGFGGCNAALVFSKSPV
jgi:3-oxoacyl-[acyl-carrier-protein] synthase-1